MKVTKDALVAGRSTRGSLDASLGSLPEEDEQAMSDLVRASLQDPHTSPEGAEHAEATSMLWSSEGILRQALLSPGLVTFASSEEPKKDMVTIKPVTPLPPLSELAQTVDPLLELHSTEPFSQFAYKLATSPELLEPLPPISEVHKALGAASRDQLLSSSAPRDAKDLTYRPATSPLPSDVAGSLLLSSSREPLPTISSSQVSSLLSALTGSSELSNQEAPGLADMELLPPRKLAEHLDLTPPPKVAGLVPPSMGHKVAEPSLAHKVSTLTQTETHQLSDDDEIQCLTPLVDKSDSDSVEILPSSRITTSKPTSSVSQSKSVCSFEKLLTKASEGGKSGCKVTKKRREVGPLMERVACFKCSFCPFLSLDTAGVARHIREEHIAGAGGSRSAPRDPSPTPDLHCPGCPNIFFTTQALQVHLVQDHRVSDTEVQQILDVFCAPQSAAVEPEPVAVETQTSPEARKKKAVAPRKKPASKLATTAPGKQQPSTAPVKQTTQVSLKPMVKSLGKSESEDPGLEVFTDQAGQVRVRGRGPPAQLPVAAEPSAVTPEEGISPVERPTTSSAPSTTPATPDDEKISAESQVDLEDGGAKRRGRPRGSRTMGLTALRKQNPSLRLGEKELGYCCGLGGCAVRLRSHDNIEYHRRCHRSGDTFSCPECYKELRQWRMVSAHLWQAHRIDMELYACDQCSFKTNSYSKLVNLHQRTHGAERPFLCDSCGKGFKTVKQLRNHKVIHETTGQRLRVSKSGECEVCQRPFADRRLLRIHRDTVHAKLRPFLCNYCGYSAGSKSSLKMHMRQHTGEKPFACPECSYRTADHNSLRRHRMRHSGERQYKCPHCAYACIQSSTYKTHLRNKHPGLDGGLLFCCPHCPFKTIKKENHVAHLAEHEPSSAPPRTKKAEGEPRRPSKARSKAAAKSTPQVSGNPPPKAKEKVAKPAEPPPPPPQAPTSKRPIDLVKPPSWGNKKKTKKNARSTQTETAAPKATKRDSTPQTSQPVQVAEASSDTANGAVRDLLTENLQLIYSQGGLSALETLLHPGLSAAAVAAAAEESQRAVASQLRLAAQLGELGLPVLTLIDGGRLLQIGGAELLPVSLTPLQAASLQLQLEGSDAEQITGDLQASQEQAAATVVVSPGVLHTEPLELRFKTAG